MAQLLERTHLYFNITRFGHFWPTKMYGSPTEFMANIEPYEPEWKQYNPRKPINREGLSITSVDGGFSGVPDLDSLLDYNRENSTRITELDIRTPTPIFDYAKPFMGPLEPWIRRSHVIRLPPGGYFPQHRDNQRLNIDSFRLFVPLVGCNRDRMFFMMDDKVLSFNNGYTYFIDTCIEHTLFNPGIWTSYFIVFNVEITYESVETLIKNMLIV